MGSPAFTHPKIPSGITRIRVSSRPGARSRFRLQGLAGKIIVGEAAVGNESIVELSRKGLTAGALGSRLRFGDFGNGWGGYTVGADGNIWRAKGEANAAHQQTRDTACCECSWPSSETSGLRFPSASVDASSIARETDAWH